MLPKRIQNNRLLVKPDEAEKKTESGIIIPDQYLDKPNIGEVVMVGDQQFDIVVNVGDRVVYQRGAGIRLVLDGKEYLLMKKVELLYVE